MKIAEKIQLDKQTASRQNLKDFSTAEFFLKKSREKEFAVFELNFRVLKRIGFF